MSSRPGDDTPILDRALALADEIRGSSAAAANTVADADAWRRRFPAVGAAPPGGAPLLRLCTADLRGSGHFDLLGAGLQEALCGDPFHQHEDLSDGVHTLTAVRFEGRPAAEIHAAMVHMPWDLWWRGGRVVNWRRSADGEVSFFLWPVWPKIPIRVRITIDPTVKVTERIGELERAKLVMKARFSGCFEGPARFEVISLPDGGVLRAAWEGIHARGWTRLLPRQRIARNHLAAEKGVMPESPGGGYAGLRDFLPARRLRN